MEQSLSHVDHDGNLAMVDVADKTPTRRVAEASCVVATTWDVQSLAPSPEGFDAVVTARLAGIQAAKNTSQLIPLCHPLTLHNIGVEVSTDPRGVKVRSRVVTVERTGVEMEALVACSFTALSLLDSLLGHDHGARIEDAHVVTKSGGTSGDWVAYSKGPQY
jgi:cyclic pyranopterin phosphate synthase